MINIKNVEHIGKVTFSVDENLNNVTLKIKDRNYGSEVYIKEFEDELHIVKYVPEWEGHN